jgi:hypothetical protein
VVSFEWRDCTDCPAIPVGKLVKIGPLKTLKTLKSEDWISFLLFEFAEPVDHNLLYGLSAPKTRM